MMKRFPLFVPFVVTLAGFTVSATAQTPATPANTTRSAPVVDLAFDAYKLGNFSVAHQEAAKRLEKNKSDSAAMTLLGLMYAQGFGVPPDQKTAAQWYTAAALHGDAHAMASLGMMTIEGRGVVKNLAEGKVWLEKAAALNEPAACFNLAFILLSHNTEADDRQAIALLKIAAQAGIDDAQHALGVAYLEGRGIERNASEAISWFKLAAYNGNIAGEVEYATLLFQGKGIDKDEELSAKYFLRAAAKGNPVAQNRLARLYLTGHGVPINKVEAAAWHFSAAAQGLTDPLLDSELQLLTADERAGAERLFRKRLMAQ